MLPTHDVPCPGCGKALYSAVYHGHHDIAKLLLEHGAHPDQEVESSADAVWIAIRNRDRRMLELLGSYAATWEIALPLDWRLTYKDIAATGIRRPLKILAYYGDIETAARLLAADPALADDPEALQAAAGKGREDFVQQLLGFTGSFCFEQEAEERLARADMRRMMV